MSYGLMDELEGLREELKQTQLAYQMAVQTSQFKGGFLSRIAHELRSPLSSLMGLHQLILSNLCESPEEEREFITQAYQSAQKLMKILDAIIMVSKIEYGSILLETCPTQLAQIFSTLYDLTRLQAANRNLQLAFSSPDSRLYVAADPQRFLQALLMLVDTAITAMQKGNIQLSAHALERSNLAQIDLEVEGLAHHIWNEPSEVLQQQSKSTSEPSQLGEQQQEISPGMKFLLAKTLLKKMQGHLEILEMSPEEAQKPLTRLRCLLPLSFPDAVAQESTAD